MKKLFLSLAAMIIAVSLFAQTNKNVGINNTDPKTSLDVNGGLSLRIKALPLGNGANNDVNISDGYSFYRITGPSAAFSISGLTNGYDGRVVTLYNSTGKLLTLKTLDGTVTAADQIN